MRISQHLTNSEWLAACAVGLLLAPALWVLLIMLQIIVEAVG